MNIVGIMGRMVADPELKKTTTNKSVVSFTIAVADGKDTDFLDCEAWESTADLINKFIRKGDVFGINGKIKTRSYTSREGKQVKKAFIRAEHVSFGGKQKEESIDSNEMPW